MPLFYKHHLSNETKIAVWNIAEPESFFLEKVPVSNAITHWHKRLQHLAGRYLLQELFPDFPYHLIEIADTRKPYLPNEEYHFSISHAGDYAAVIVSRDQRVGIDIEQAAEKIEKIKHKFLGESEFQGLVANSNRSDINSKMLTLFWSCKEAIFKWYGNGKVDFKKHICLKPDDKNLSQGFVICEFSKEKKIMLNIQFKFFKDTCLSWVVQ